MKADRLFTAPPEEFVALRRELAADLRKRGEREEAARVAALRKPTLPVWAVNLAARADRSAVRRVVRSAERLGELQLAGRPDDFRAAQAEFAAALQALGHVAREQLDAHGHPPSDAVAERIGRTLRAAATDLEAREQLAGGRLQEELEPQGFGGLVVPPDGAGRTPAARRARPTARDRQREERARKRRERVEELEAELREASAEAAEARRVAEQRERRVETLERQLHRFWEKP